jgi:hypothetical protein
MIPAGSMAVSAAAVSPSGSDDGKASIPIMKEP